MKCSLRITTTHVCCRTVLGITLLAARTYAQTPAETTDAAPVGVELLHAMPMRVTVSSCVDNAHDRPSDLVDGALDTAWNSRTGDLRGAWIEVVVPPGATVSGLRMTAGYTRTTPGGDLFVQNHRVRQVRVLHDGVEQGRFALDVARRDLQTLAVSGGAGVYRIEFTALAPGTRRGWREACVSELQVWGTPAPGVVSRPVTPSVEVAPEPMQGPFATVDAWCARAGARVRCEPTSAVPDESPMAAASPPVLEARMIRTTDANRQYRTAALRTASGWYFDANNTIVEDDSMVADATITHAEMERSSAVVERGATVGVRFRYLHWTEAGNELSDGNSFEPDASRMQITCRADGARFRCGQEEEVSLEARLRRRLVRRGLRQPE